MSLGGRSGQLTMLLQQAVLANLDGDTALRHVAASAAVRILDAGSVAALATRLRTYGTALDDASADRDSGAAVAITRRGIRDLLPSESPMVLGLAHWYLARSENAAGQPVAALRAVHEGRRWIADTPDLESVLPLLRSEEIRALAALGRTAEADSLRRAAPTRGPAAPCTPGGAWQGCPDLP